MTLLQDLHNAPKENYWGYVTGGGTEGNMYGLYLGRQTFPDAVAYYSKAAHYSIKKNLNILRIESCEIDTGDLDVMNYDDLREKIDPSRPAIILASIGTTMMQARDDISKIQSILAELKVKDKYIHCDAALDGMIAPFLDPKPAFDFSDGADSIAVSGHKFIGCPIPCGIVLCKRNNVEAISKFIPYINGYDETIPGSRNGITPLFLWYTISKLGYEGLRQRAMKCLSVASYGFARLKDSGIDVRRHPNTITLIFPKPQDWVVRKWQLATQGDLAHILTVPGVECHHLDEFIHDYLESLSSDS